MQKSLVNAAVPHEGENKPLAGIEESPGEKLDLAWGARAIGKAIRKNPRQTYYLLELGAIPGARKVADQWVADLVTLRKAFRGVAAWKGADREQA
jgi:hypothetical protein